MSIFYLDGNRVNRHRLLTSFKIFWPAYLAFNIYYIYLYFNICKLWCKGITHIHNFANLFHLCLLHMTIKRWNTVCASRAVEGVSSSLKRKKHFSQHRLWVSLGYSLKHSIGYKKLYFKNSQFKIMPYIFTNITLAVYLSHSSEWLD